VISKGITGFNVGMWLLILEIELASSVKRNPFLSCFTLAELCSQCRYLFAFCGLYKSLGKSADIAFGDWGASVPSEEQICHANKDVYATVMVAEELFKLFIE
jgi:hypothetical protein